MQDTEVEKLREVRVLDLILFYFLPLVILIGLWVFYIINAIVYFIDIKIWMFLLILAISYLMLRLHAIGCVLMYKAFAPLDLRCRCRYQPTCSTYMMISIWRYGIVLGIIMGIKRIKRCKPPYGGYDMPTLKSLKKGYEKKLIIEE